MRSPPWRSQAARGGLRELEIRIWGWSGDAPSRAASIQLPVEQSESDHIGPEYQHTRHQQSAGSESDTLDFAVVEHEHHEPSSGDGIRHNANTPNRTNMTGRAPRGTGPGTAAMASMIENASSRRSGLAPTVPLCPERVSATAAE